MFYMLYVIQLDIFQVHCLFTYVLTYLFIFLQYTLIHSHDSKG